MVSKALRSIGVIFWLAAVATYVTSMITVFWIKGVAITYNLFRNCVVGVCIDQGWDITNDASIVGIATFVPRILMLAGAFFVVIGFVFGLASACSDNPCPLISEGALEITGGIIILVACAVFTALNFPTNNIIDTQEFGYSFYLGWVSGLSFLISGAFTCASARS